MKKIVLSCVLSLGLLTGCTGSNRAINYYKLPNSELQLPPTTTKTTGIKVVLTEALKTPSLVYQTDAYKLSFTKNSLWAEPLDIALENNLANKLNQHNSKLKFIPHANIPTATVLEVHISSFQGTYLGETKIEGYTLWQQNNKSKLGNNFKVITKQEADGYDAMIQALETGLAQVVEQIKP